MAPGDLPRRGALGAPGGWEMHQACDGTLTGEMDAISHPCPVLQAVEVMQVPSILIHIVGQFAFKLLRGAAFISHDAY